MGPRTNEDWEGEKFQPIFFSESIRRSPPSTTISHHYFFRTFPLDSPQNSPPNRKEPTRPHTNSPPPGPADSGHKLMPTNGRQTFNRLRSRRGFGQTPRRAGPQNINLSKSNLLKVFFSAEKESENRNRAFECRTFFAWISEWDRVGLSWYWLNVLYYFSADVPFLVGILVCEHKQPKPISNVVCGGCKYRHKNVGKLCRNVIASRFARKLFRAEFLTVLQFRKGE